MAVALFFRPPTISSSTSNLLADEGSDEEATDIDTVHAILHRHVHTEDDSGSKSDSEDSSSEGQQDTSGHQENTEDGEEENETVVEGCERDPSLRETQHGPSQPNGELDLTNLAGRRVTLKPRRTLSLSPTPARMGDMTMARNLRAARWLDFTDKDDDDGLYQLSDSDTEMKRKTIGSTDEIFASSRFRIPRRTGSLSLGALAGLNRDFLPIRKNGSSIKRPLEPTLPCQEIKYLDISYQKVQFSPIARKKINYLPVPYHAIHYCDVNYLGERPVKRKPPSECI